MINELENVSVENIQLKHIEKNEWNTLKVCNDL